MNIGIIGMGVVGSALKSGFEKLQFDVVPYDINLQTDFCHLIDTEIVYICLPTPTSENGQCDTSLISAYTEKLRDIQYTGVIAIKSTCSPGTTQRLIEKYPSMNIAFVPEFLKERSAEFDFIHNHNLLIIGTNDVLIGDVVMRSHHGLAKSTLRMSPTEAEILKYMHNCFAALRVVYANMFSSIAEEYEANYDTIKNGFVAKNYLPDDYLDVSPNLQGYGGPCLPKDAEVIRGILSEKNINFTLIEAMIRDNSNLLVTVFDGMRGN